MNYPKNQKSAVSNLGLGTAQASPPRDLAVHSSLGFLDNSIEKLESLVYTLRNRLEPVLQISPASTNHEESKYASSNTPLCSNIDRQVERVRTLQVEVSSMLEMLEV
jgi:hypothetical protein